MAAHNLPTIRLAVLFGDITTAARVGYPAMKSISAKQNTLLHGFYSKIHSTPLNNNRANDFSKTKARFFMERQSQARHANVVDRIKGVSEGLVNNTVISTQGEKGRAFKK